MARLALPASWAGALTRQRGPLRTYQWLWLLLCTLGALVVAAPRILSQPLIYTSSAAITFDTARYGSLYRDGEPTADYLAVQEIAISLLRFRQDGEQPRYPGLGSPTLGVRYDPQPDGTVNVLTVGRTPAEAQQLADDAAEALARSIRAAGGREIFRVLSGGYLVNALLHGNAAPTLFEEQLRTLYLTSAFLLNKPTDPDARQIRVEQLAAEDLSNLARAFEVRDVEIVNVELPSIRARIAQAQLDCRAALRIDKERAQQECLDEQRLTTGLDAIRRALEYPQHALCARHPLRGLSLRARPAASPPGRAEYPALLGAGRAARAGAAAAWAWPSTGACRRDAQAIRAVGLPRADPQPGAARPARALQGQRAGLPLDAARAAAADAGVLAGL